MCILRGTRAEPEAHNLVCFPFRQIARGFIRSGGQQHWVKLGRDLTASFDGFMLAQSDQDAVRIT